MRRRDMLLSTGAAVVGLSTFPIGWTAAADNSVVFQEVFKEWYPSWAAPLGIDASVAKG